jgi:hypothetical protein
MYYFVFGVISWSIHSIRSLNLSYRKKLKRKNLSLTPFSLAAACFPPSSLPPARPTPSWAGWRVAHLARPPPRASPSFGTTGWRARPSSRGSVARLGAAQLGGPAAPCAPQRPRSLRARARWAVAQPPPPLVGPTSQPHHHAPVHLLSPTHIFSPSPHAARPSPPPHPRRSEPPPSTPSARPSSHGEPRLPLFFLAPPLLPHPGPCLPRPLAQHGHGACAPPPSRPPPCALPAAPRLGAAVPARPIPGGLGVLMAWPRRARATRPWRPSLERPRPVRPLSCAARPPAPLSAFGVVSARSAWSRRAQLGPGTAMAWWRGPAPALARHGPFAVWPRPGAASALAVAVPLRSTARAQLGPGVCATRQRGLARACSRGARSALARLAVPSAHSSTPLAVPVYPPPPPPPCTSCVVIALFISINGTQFRNWLR